MILVSLPATRWQHHTYMISILVHQLNNRRQHLLEITFTTPTVVSSFQWLFLLCTMQDKTKCQSTSFPIVLLLMRIKLKIKIACNICHTKPENEQVIISDPVSPGSFSRQKLRCLPLWFSPVRDCWWPTGVHSWPGTAQPRGREPAQQMARSSWSPNPPKLEN